MNLSAHLAAWAAEELGAPIENATPIGSGASRETWRIVAGGVPRVLRVDPGTGPVAGTALDLTREAGVYRMLAGSGLPLPALLATTPDALLMELCPGEESLAAVVDDDQRAAVGRDYMGWLGRLHLLALDGGVTARDGTLADAELWSTIAAERTKGWATPAVARALEWLIMNAPVDAGRASMCHGDAGPGNFLFSGEHVTALLDWEFAHLGDPHDDLAWVSVRNHLLGRPLDIADALAAWSAVTSRGIDAERIEYYRVFVLTRMAVSCDATLAWKDGVEDDSTRTQSLLRPWLGTAITTALRMAGCRERWLPRLAAGAEQSFSESPHAPLLGLIPPLERVVAA
jgi:aminoglycoside phosphotransferase (APT) family kinase protein